MARPMRAAWLLLALALPAGAVRAQTAAAPSPVASVTQTTTGDHNTTIGIVNGQVMISGVDPATVASMVKTFTDQISATAEARAQAEARAAEMGAKLGFTTLAVTEFFRILGEQNVPERDGGTGCGGSGRRRAGPPGAGGTGCRPAERGRRAARPGACARHGGLSAGAGAAQQ